MNFSIIIPVYNRSVELDELLQSIVMQQYKSSMEIIVVEDGSILTSEKIIDKYKDSLLLKYFYKENSGPGDSRNYGMQKATGDYFIILDSDCILPENYLSEVKNALQKKFTDAFGGADAAHPGFNNIQKAVNYSMTSFLTTGGLRGSVKARNKFQLRSFNMGISKDAFIKTRGFSKQYLGEDIDLTFRLWEIGLKTQFIPQAFVYHKRRSTWSQFINQSFNFGATRPILNKMHPKSGRLTFWFPSIFVIGFLFAILGLLLDSNWIILFYAVYFLSIFIDSYIKNKKLAVAVLSIYATLIQFFGYGSGFLRSEFRLNILNRSEKESFPKMFEKG